MTFDVDAIEQRQRERRAELPLLPSAIDPVAITWARAWQAEAAALTATLAAYREARNEIARLHTLGAQLGHDYDHLAAQVAVEDDPDYSTKVMRARQAQARAEGRVAELEAEVEHRIEWTREAHAEWERNQARVAELEAAVKVKAGALREAQDAVGRFRAENERLRAGASADEDSLAQWIQDAADLADRAEQAAAQAARLAEALEEIRDKGECVVPPGWRDETWSCSQRADDALAGYYRTQQEGT